MQARDVMTTKVVTATPDTTIDDIIAMMLENHISAVPVVDDDGEVIGLVSEGDLLRRIEGAKEARKSWWLSLLSEPEMTATDFVKLKGRHARDVMTHEVLSVAPDTPIGKIAILLEKNRIKRVPVIEAGKLVGLVSRANLLQGLAASPVQTPGADATDDRALRDAVMAALRSIPGFDTSFINVTVQNRDVKIWGIADTDAEEAAARVAAENVSGIGGVDVHLGRVPTWVWGF